MPLPSTHKQSYADLCGAVPHILWPAYANDIANPFGSRSMHLTQHQLLKTLLVVLRRLFEGEKAEMDDLFQPKLNKYPKMLQKGDTRSGASALAAVGRDMSLSWPQFFHGFTSASHTLPPSPALI